MFLYWVDVDIYIILYMPFAYIYIFYCISELNITTDILRSASSET